VGLLLILGGGVAGWRLFLHPSVPTAVAPAPKTAALALPDKPSIAVLPFVNMSGDSGQEYFSEGMTEDLITELSRLTGLFIIARHSVFTYKGKAVKPDQVSRELGVRYMLEGSVRKAQDRVRITAQLVDTMTGYRLWADRYDRDLQDIFAVQEEIARRITGALAVQLTPEEAERMGLPYTSSHEAWEEFIKGSDLYRHYTKEDNKKAREHFEAAIRKDPQFARAYASLSATHRTDWNFGFTEPPETSKTLAFETVKNALTLDEFLPHAHQQLVYLYLYSLEDDDHYEKAITHARRAVAIDSNYADAYAAWAQVLTYTEHSDDALRLMEKAIRLNPKPPGYYYYHVGQAYYVLGKNDQAIGPLLRALEINDNFRPARSYLVAVYHKLGRPQDAQKHMRILRDRGRPPSSAEYVKRVAPFKNEAITNELRQIWQQVESEISGATSPSQRAP
jgi:adenylate cyclase